MTHNERPARRGRLIPGLRGNDEDDPLLQLARLVSGKQGALKETPKLGSDLPQKLPPMEPWMRNMLGLEQRRRDLDAASLLAMLEAELGMDERVVSAPYDPVAARAARQEAAKALELSPTLSRRNPFKTLSPDLITKIEVLELARYHRWGITIDEVPY